MRRVTKSAATNVYCRWSPEDSASPDLPTNTRSSTRLSGRWLLWDIDLIIKRTLHYTSLTAVLALIYFGLVAALQIVASRFIGQASNSDVSIVISTLTIAALFQPLRHNIQQGIDRRFYRSKYDAVKTLEAFSATLSNETDLNELSEQLVIVIQETMQPTGVALWLFQPAEDKAAEASKTRILPAIGECDNVGARFIGSTVTPRG
jgi:hypothetical protein